MDNRNFRIAVRRMGSDLEWSPKLERNLKALADMLEYRASSRTIALTAVFSNIMRNEGLAHERVYAAHAAAKAIVQYMDESKNYPRYTDTAKELSKCFMLHFGATSLDSVLINRAKALGIQYLEARETEYRKPNLINVVLNNRHAEWA